MPRGGGQCHRENKPCRIVSQREFGIMLFGDERVSTVDQDLGYELLAP